MNNRHRSWVVLLCLTGVGSVASRASNSPQVLPDLGAYSSALSEQPTGLSLGDAVYLALRNNRNIRSAYLQRVAQKFDLRVVEQTFRPKLSLNGGYTTSRGSEDRERDFTLAPATSLLGEYGTRLSIAWTRQHSNSDLAGPLRSDGLDVLLTQPLLRGAGRDVTTAPLRLARLSELANRLQLEMSVAQTMTTVITRYRELLRAQERRLIAEQALQRALALLRVNKALIAAGRMAEIETVQTDADIANQQLALEDALNQVQINQLALLRLLALDLTSDIRASEVLEVAQVMVDKREALIRAKQRQPEYRMALLHSQQSDLNLVMAEDQARWDVSLVGGANQLSNRRKQATEGSGRQWNGYVGVQVEIPIGDLATHQAEVHARVEVDSQSLLLADAWQALELDVSDAVRDMSFRWRQYELALRANDLAKQKLLIEQEKLNVGRSSNFQVLSFEADLRSAENALLDAKITYLNAQTRFNHSIGMTLESWDVTLDDV